MGNGMCGGNGADGDRRDAWLVLLGEMRTGGGWPVREFAGEDGGTVAANCVTLPGEAPGCAAGGVPPGSARRVGAVRVFGSEGSTILTDGEFEALWAAAGGHPAELLARLREGLESSQALMWRLRDAEGAGGGDWEMWTQWAEILMRMVSVIDRIHAIGGADAKGGTA